MLHHNTEKPSALGKNLPVGIALSGGVDSSTAAALLLEQGYAVEAFFLLLLPEGEQQLDSVRLVADRLGIPLHTLDLREQFRQQVVAAFTAAYRQGLTPNPCIICNQLIKFGLLLQAMLAKGMEAMATGHYARVDQGRLYRGCDPLKDQSYFLCRLASSQLSRLILPLGSWRKEEVFKQARAVGFTHFDGSESQDVCFLAGQDLPTFLASQGLISRSGEVLTNDGRSLGTHQGIWNYTVGQRRGLGLPDATPWYVTGLVAERNEVLVGKNAELLQRELRLTEMQWHIPLPALWQGKVQLRSHHRAAQAQVSPAAAGSWQVCFVEAQRAVSPGQFAVLYEGDQVVGSGVIGRSA